MRATAHQAPSSDAGTVDDLQLRPKHVINKRQRLILAATAAIMVGMILFPPFHLMVNGHEVKASGYHFGLQFENASVDRVMLGIQLAVAVLAGAIGTLCFHTRA